MNETINNAVRPETFRRANNHLPTKRDNKFAPFSSTCEIDYDEVGHPQKLYSKSYRLFLLLDIL